MTWINPRGLSILSLGLALSLCLTAQAAPPGSSAAAPASGKAAAVPAGIPVSIGMTYSIPSRVLGMDRKITVRLPYEYQNKENAARAYPVLYLIDGGPEQDYPHIAGIAQLSDTNPAWGEFILVGVETVNRRAEISPDVVDAAKYKDLGAVPGGSAKFREFLRSEVMPWVRGQ